MNEFNDKFNLFLSKLNTYKPREYVVENLSIEVREKALMELIESIKFKNDINIKPLHVSRNSL